MSPTSDENKAPESEIDGGAPTKLSSDDPLHGVTLKAMLTELVDELGWDDMSGQIRIRCFANDPSISSSLKFLRKTPWARNKVEELYLKRKSRKGG